MLSGQFQCLGLTLPPPWLVAHQDLKVDFSSEAADGIVLCPSDIDPSNFMIDSKGTLFAIDFGRIGSCHAAIVCLLFV